LTIIQPNIEESSAALIETSCPVCGSLNCSAVYPAHVGECITSDLQIVINSNIANHLCEACGFIFNAGGPRGRTEEFYGSAYRLRMHSDSAQNINLSGADAVPMARAVADFLSKSRVDAKAARSWKPGPARARACFSS
jgi:hypothetical protein